MRNPTFITHTTMDMATATLLLFQIAMLVSDKRLTWEDCRGAKEWTKTYMRRTINSEAAAKDK
jgi:hypothetical protein